MARCGGGSRAWPAPTGVARMGCGDLQTGVVHGSVGAGHAREQRGLRMRGLGVNGFVDGNEINVA